MPVLVSSGRAHAALRCFVAALVTAALLVGFAALLIWVFFQPGLVEYSVTRATADDFSLVNATVTGTFEFDVDTYNPNSAVSVLYDRAEFLVLYPGAGGEQELAAASHFQTQEDESWLYVRAVARATPVTDSDVIRSLEHDVAAGEVSINVLMRARVRYKIAGFTTWGFQVRAFCSNVVIDLSGPASQDTSCTVEVY